MADVYGMPVSVITSEEGPALGVAILAMVGTGIYPDVKSACDKIVKVKETQQHNPEHTKRYQPVYELYKSLYQHLKEVFNVLAEL